MARNWANSGKLNLAARAAEASFAPTSRPVKLTDLKGGGESNVSLMAAPHGGQARAQIWKQSRPGGDADSPEIWKRRAQMGAANQDNPAFAQFLGESQGPKGSLTHKYEFVPGKTLSGTAIKADQRTAEKYMQSKVDGERAARAQGFTMLDTKPENMVMPEGGGKPKIVDYLPFKKNEIASNGLRHNMKIPEWRPMLTEEGFKLYPNQAQPGPEYTPAVRALENRIRAKSAPRTPPLPQVPRAQLPGTETEPARFSAMRAP